jgi:hypothetical protein
VNARALNILIGLIGLLGLAAILVGIPVQYAWAKARLRRRLRRREVLRFDDWYDRYYPDRRQDLPPEHVTAVLVACARLIDVDITQLHPRDPLDGKEAWFVPSFGPICDDKALQEFAMARTAHHLEFDERWHTVDDLIQGVVHQIIAWE